MLLSYVGVFMRSLLRWLVGKTFFALGASANEIHDRSECAVVATVKIHEGRPIPVVVSLVVSVARSWTN